VLATLGRSLILRLFFLALLLIEIIAITTHFEVPFLPNSATISGWLFDFSKEYWQVALWITGACLAFLTPHYKPILGEFAVSIEGYRWPSWLALHLLTFVTFALLTSLIFKQPADPARLTVGWFSVWIALASTTLVLWLLAFAPKNFWLSLVRQNRTEILAGVLLGISAWMLIGMLVRQEAPFAQKELWALLSGLTLKIAYCLLSLGYSDLIFEPSSLVVGTASFPVKVSYACSGIEGVVLIIVFLAIYLWLFRNDLRFPQAFWLFPLGILAIWLANAIRIAMLVVIGSSFSPDIAGMGFHAQAGWIAFTLISLGAIAISHRMRFFSHKNPELMVDSSGNSTLAAALLTPFLVQMAALMVSSAFSSGFDLLYPIRIGVVTAVLWYYRKTYNKVLCSWSWQASAMGVLVFMIWILLEPNSQSNGTALLQGFKKLPSEFALLWLIFRVLGSSIVVPLAEEFAFRGYLIRKLIAKDFDKVAVGQFTWPSFIISSLLFGLLHERWLAGTLAGMGYAIALYRRGRLGDAIAAHMTTNALIAIYVITQGKWSLWI